MSKWLNTHQFNGTYMMIFNDENIKCLFNSLNEYMPMNVPILRVDVKNSLNWQVEYFDYCINYYFNLNKFINNQLSLSTQISIPVSNLDIDINRNLDLFFNRHLLNNRLVSWWSKNINQKSQGDDYKMDYSVPKKSSYISVKAKTDFWFLNSLFNYTILENQFKNETDEIIVVIKKILEKNDLSNQFYKYLFDSNTFLYNPSLLSHINSLVFLNQTRFVAFLNSNLTNVISMNSRGDMMIEMKKIELVNAKCQFKHLQDIIKESEFKCIKFVPVKFYLGLFYVSNYSFVGLDVSNDTYLLDVNFRINSYFPVQLQPIVNHLFHKYYMLLQEIYKDNILFKNISITQWITKFTQFDLDFIYEFQSNLIPLISHLLKEEFIYPESDINPIYYKYSSVNPLYIWISCIFNFLKLNPSLEINLMDLEAKIKQVIKEPSGIDGFTLLE